MQRAILPNRGARRWHPARHARHEPVRNTTLGFALAGSGGDSFCHEGRVLQGACGLPGVDYLTVTALRALLALPMFAALAVWRGMSLRGAPRSCRAAGGGSQACCATASGHCWISARWRLIDVSLERALMFSYPALIVAWYAIVRRTRPRPGHAAGAGAHLRRRAAGRGRLRRGGCVAAEPGRRTAGAVLRSHHGSRTSCWANAAFRTWAAAASRWWRWPRRRCW